MKCLIWGSFSSDRKNSNIVPIYIKGHKQTLKNYHPVPLLPIWGKIFERFIFNEFFRIFIDSKLIAMTLPSFKPGE